MQDKVKMLFVCHGNICRSPMAEFYMKDLVKRKGIQDCFQIASAATTDEEIWNDYGNPVYPPAKNVLLAHGINPEGKRACLMSYKDYERYDWLIGMDEENLYDMRRICHGDPDHKIALLLDHCDCPRDVADPWYTRDFNACWKDIVEGCDAWYDWLMEKNA